MLSKSQYRRKQCSLCLTAEKATCNTVRSGMAQVLDLQRTTYSLEPGSLPAIETMASTISAESSLGFRLRARATAWRRARMECQSDSAQPRFSRNQNQMPVWAKNVANRIRRGDETERRKQRRPEHTWYP